MAKKYKLLGKFCFKCQRVWGVDNDKCPQCKEELEPIYDYSTEIEPERK